MSSRNRIVLIGAGGRLGAALVRAYATDNCVTSFTHAQLDLGNLEELRRVLGTLEYDVLINSAALTNVDRCETHPEEAYALNTAAAEVMARCAADKRARMIHISTDYVFDGEAMQPYREEDEAKPISVYGASKLEGERLVLAADDRHVVARVSWIFGPDRPSFIDAVLARAREHEDAAAVADKVSTPTYTLDVAEMLRPFLHHDFPGGLLHLANSGACSWQGYAQWALDTCHRLGLPMKAKIVAPLTLEAMKSFIARRPPYTVLATERFERMTGIKPRPWQEAVASYVRDYVARDFVSSNKVVSDR